MRNQAATMAAPMRPATMPSLRHRDRESMGGPPLQSVGPRSGGSLARVYHHRKQRATGACPGGLRGIGRQAHHHLAQVVAREKAEEGLGGVFDAFHHGFLSLDTARLEPSADLGQEFGVEGGMGGNDEALHPRPATDQREEVARAG